MVQEQRQKATTQAQTKLKCQYLKMHAEKAIDFPFKVFPWGGEKDWGQHGNDLQFHLLHQANVKYCCKFDQVQSILAATGIDNNSNNEKSLITKQSFILSHSLKHHSEQKSFVNQN